MKKALLLISLAFLLNSAFLIGTTLGVCEESKEDEKFICWTDEDLGKIGEKGLGDGYTESSYTLYDFYNVNDDSEAEVNNGQWLGQNITATSTYFLKGISWKVGTTGGDAGDCIIELSNADVNGHPNGGLASTTFDSLDLTDDDWYYVEGFNDYEITEAYVYTIVIKCPEGSSGVNYMDWRRDGSTPDYYQGFMIYTTDSGSSWNDLTGADVMFEMWGTTTSSTSDSTTSNSVIDDETAYPFIFFSVIFIFLFTFWIIVKL